MGTVEVICTDPTKLARLSSGPRLAAECCSGPSVMLVLPSDTPAIVKTAKAIAADCVAEGFAQATPVLVWANVTNFVAGTVSAFELASLNPGAY